jgi:hypothetical protein
MFVFSVVKWRFNPKDRDSTFFWNVDIYLQVHTALQARTPTSATENWFWISSLITGYFICIFTKGITCNKKHAVRVMLDEPLPQMVWQCNKDNWTAEQWRPVKESAPLGVNNRVFHAVPLIQFEAWMPDVANGALSSKPPKKVVK